jgi:hypothetical protein
MSSSGKSRVVAGSAQFLECVQIPTTYVDRNFKRADIVCLLFYQLFDDLSALE